MAYFKPCYKAILLHQFSSLLDEDTFCNKQVEIREESGAEEKHDCSESISRRRRGKHLSSLRIDICLPLAKPPCLLKTTCWVQALPNGTAVCVSLYSLSDSSSASRSQVKNAVTDFKATPLPVCSAGSLLDSHL